ncbi:MAG: efflux RND transporter permease subunit [Gemmatimonadetes bacterium]|nr:efflux RND transporter permease subunit [Gemmatimonadota bacterium]
MQAGSALGATDLGTVYIRMIHKADRNVSQSDFGEMLRKDVQQIGGAKVYVFTTGFGGARKQIQVELRGKDARMLGTLADSVLHLVQKIPGAVDVSLSTKGQKPPRTWCRILGTVGMSCRVPLSKRRPGYNVACSERSASLSLHGEA